MLLKLFKYDIKKLFKEVLPVYAFSFVSIILLVLLSKFDYQSNLLTDQ